MIMKTNYFRKGYRKKAELIYDLRESIKVHIIFSVVCTLCAAGCIALGLGLGQPFFTVVGCIFAASADIFALVLFYKIIMLRSHGQELCAIATMCTTQPIKEEFYWEGEPSNDDDNE